MVTRKITISQLWTEPDEPFEATFSGRESTTDATLELNTNRYRASETGKTPTSR